ncbi:MAG: hypothetical protein NTW86_09065 [Candidatus Sumerlaeota bacterium]|nr:hypothetical protein [Candidatus Sumerlaeota bacterium]
MKIESKIDEVGWVDELDAVDEVDKSDGLGGLAEFDKLDALSLRFTTSDSASVGMSVTASVGADSRTDDFHAWALIDETRREKRPAALPNAEANDSGARAMGTSPSLDGSGSG